jgi:hypothetical protein
MKIDNLTKVFCIIFTLAIIAMPFPSLANNKNSGWYATIHAGEMTFDDTSEIFIGNFSMDESYLAGVGIGKEIYEIKKDFTLDLEAQFFKHFKDQDHEEYNLVPILKWKNLNWLGDINSSFSIGNGISYASEIPKRELAVQGADGSNDLLNYVMMEKSIKIPSSDNYEFSLRYHHRSGMFGLYDNAREASTAFLLGIKYNFD